MQKRFDITLCIQFQPLYPQRQFLKKINGKEKSKLMEDVEIFVSNDIQEEETIDNEILIMTKVDIQEFKAKQ